MSVDEFAHLSLAESSDKLQYKRSQQLAVACINVLNKTFKKTITTLRFSSISLCPSQFCVCVCVCEVTVLIRAVSSYKSRPVQTSRIQGFLCCCQAGRVFLGLLLLFLPLPAAVLCCFFGGVFSFSIHKFKIKMLIVLCSQILNISFFFFF